MVTRQTVMYHAGTLVYLSGMRVRVNSVGEIIAALPAGDCSATVWCGGQADLMDVLGMMLAEYSWNGDPSRLGTGECTGYICADHSILSLAVKTDGRHHARFLDLTSYCEYGSGAVDAATVLHDLQVTAPTPGSAAVGQMIPRKQLERFSTTYPRLHGHAEQLVSQACRGGLVWLGKAGVYRDVMDLDVNSMYPSILASEPLPYGEPVEVGGPEDLRPGQWGVFEVDVMGVPKDGMPQWLSRRARGRRGVEPPVACDRRFQPMTLTSDDLEAIEVSYDATVVVHGGLAFGTCTPFFASSTAKLGWLKDTATPDRKGVYKTLLNAFVGKFAQTQRRGTDMEIIPMLGESGRVIFRTVYGDGGGRNTRSTDVRYSPLAAAVWGKARLRLLKDMQTIHAAGGTVLYCNTDGLMVQGLGLERLRRTLPMGAGQGEYKVEAAFDRVNLLASNLYLGETMQGERLWCHSGYVEEDVPTWEEFASGRYGRVYSKMS